MDTFLKLSWRSKDISELEKEFCFIGNDVVAQSNIYKNLDEKIKLNNTDQLRVPYGAETFYPGPKLISPLAQKSCLNHWQQEQCLKALKLHQSGKDPLLYTNMEKQCVKNYNDLQSKVIEENKKFLSFARDLWEKQRHQKLRILPHMYNCAKKRFEKRFRRCHNYPQYYKNVNLLSMSFNQSESEINVKCVGTLLEVGKLAKFVPPDLRAKCFLNAVTIPAEEDGDVTSSKLRVSEDNNIKKLLNFTNVDVVTSSGALKNIIDPTNVKKDWIIPIIIKKYQVHSESGTTIKKIIFIENPLPKIHPHMLDYSYYCHKRLLRSHFCQYEAFDFPNKDEPGKEQTELEKRLSEFEKNFNKEDEDEESPPAKRRMLDQGKIYHNASYRLWHVKKTSLLNTLAKHKTKDVEFNLLVRCKLDACERTEQDQLLQTVIVRPKLELQLEFGASIPSKTELSREWTSLFFRPFSILYRVRLNNATSEVVSIEKCTMQKTLADASTFYDFKPHLGLGVLQKLLEELTEVEEEGCYMLRHRPNDGTFVTLMKDCVEKSGSALDLHAEFDKCEYKGTVGLNPLPIDINYILPGHEACNQVPGLFKPFYKAQFKKKDTTKRSYETHHSKDHSAGTTSTVDSGAVFATENSSVVVAQIGGTAKLPCVVRKFSNGVVPKVKRKKRRQQRKRIAIQTNNL